MATLLVILLSTVLVNNFVLTNFLGTYPLLGTNPRFEGALATAAATLCVLTVAAALTYLVEHWLLAPFDLLYLRTFTFIMVIAVVAQASELMIRHANPALPQLFGMFLPLITINCAALGVALLGASRSHNFVEAVCFAFGAGLGFSLVLLTFAALRERVQAADVPGVWREAPVALITAGIMALAFMGFAGLVKR